LSLLFILYAGLFIFYRWSPVISLTTGITFATLAFVLYALGNVEGERPVAAGSLFFIIAGLLVMITSQVRSSPKNGGLQEPEDTDFQG